MPGEEEACAERILATLMRQSLSAAGHRRRPQEPDAVLPKRPHGGRLRRGDRDGLERSAGEPAVPLPHRNRPARRRAALGLPHPRRPARVPLVVFSLEQHPGRRRCSTWPSAASCASPTCSNDRSAGCWPTRAREAWSTNFAEQWLHLRNLDSITPDLRLFPDFDDNLRQAFRQETELLFESVLREDRSVLDLLESDHTFLNERLAKHYGIPHVYGSRFRRVSARR